MANLNELNLKSDNFEPDDFTNPPDQFAGYTAPPYPGKYDFKLPSDLSNVWDTFKAKDFETGKESEYLQANLAKGAGLLIVASKSGHYVSETIDVWINNMKRKHGDLSFSDMGYLLLAVGEKTTPRTPQDYGRALMRHAGELFGADLFWQATCATDREVYMDDGQGGSAKKEGVYGCGKKWQSEETYKDRGEIPRDTQGYYMSRFTCTCGARLRAFPRLRNFGPASGSQNNDKVPF